MTIKINTASLRATATVALLLCAANVWSDDLTARIESLINNGKLDQALTLTDKQLAGDSANVNFLFLKGLILTRQNKMDEARDIFVRLTNDHPELPEPYNNLAVIYAAQGDFASARKALEQAINTHPSYATAHENLGDIYAKMASNAYNHALEIDSGNTTAREKLSLINNLFSARAGNQQVPDAAEQQKLADKQEQVALLEKNLTALTQKNKQQEERKQELEAELKQLDQQRRQAATLSKQEYEASRQQLQHVQLQMEQMKAELAKLEQQRAALAEQAAETAAAPAVSAPAPDKEAVKQEVLQAVDNWAAHWSGKDVEGYLASYAGNYRPKDMDSHREWVTQRRIRISKPRFIKVEIENRQVDLLDPEHARVNFDQSYSSDTYQDRVHKTMRLRKENGRWLITEEESG